MTLRTQFIILYVLAWQRWLVSSWSMDRRDLLTKTLGSATSFVVLTSTAGDHFRAVGAEIDLLDLEQGPRGLQYRILRSGDGDSPIRGQQVYAKYTLWTGGFEGKQVDSNTGFLGRPLPVIVGIGRVIKGWDLTLLEMKVGEIRRIVVPPEIGYGDQGAGGAIPPKATLYFEVELTGMDPLPQLTEAQQQWLRENPI